MITPIDMEKKEDNISRVQRFLDSVEKMGVQLKAANGAQQQYLRRLMALQKDNAEDSPEYKALYTKSQELQLLIDKYTPIYKERLDMLNSVRRRRTRRGNS